MVENDRGQFSPLVTNPSPWHRDVVGDHIWLQLIHEFQCPGPVEALGTSGSCGVVAGHRGAAIAIRQAMPEPHGPRPLRGAFRRTQQGVGSDEVTLQRGP